MDDGLSDIAGERRRAALGAIISELVDAEWRLSATAAIRWSGPARSACDAALARARAETRDAIGSLELARRAIE